MFLIEFFNNRVKRFTIFDIKLIQGIGMGVALIIAKLYPPVMDVSVWWFVLFLILCTVRPLYVMFVSK